MMFPKAPKRISDRAYMARVAALPCVICGSWPVRVHHVIHDRYSQRKASDRYTIPLCDPCHQELHDGKETWRAKHGPDHGYLAHVRVQLEGAE